MDTEGFYVVFIIFFDVKTLANLLNRVLFRKSLQIKGLELENVFANRYGFEGLFALLFQLGDELGCEKLVENILNQRSKIDLEDLHLLHVFLLEVREHYFILDINVPVFFASNDPFLYLVDVNFSFIHLTDLLNNQY